MLLDVPLLPEEAYASFLVENIRSLHSVHFSLHDGNGLDARPPMRMMDAPTLAGFLSRLQGPKKYALLNARFHRAELYKDKAFLDDICTRLDILRTEGGLTGIVYADHYLLTAMGDHSPSTAASLEAVPSVNACLDDREQILRRVDDIISAGFRPPGKIIPDRRLNRRPHTAAKLSAQLKEEMPDIAFTLLVNEGCLADCPYKQAHDARLSYYNIGHGSELRTPVNRMLGCLRLFAKEPHRIFSSPFIRPEDLNWVEEYADTAKICGRSRGAEVLRRIVEAYRDEGYAGNLLDLLDAPEMLAETLEIANENLPNDFFQRLCGDRRDVDTFAGALESKHLRKKARTPGGIRTDSICGV
jgi:hypothetical protein